MFKNTKAFSSFSVNDLQKAKEFYSNVLGLEVNELPNMGLELHINGNNLVFVYPKDNAHVPATFTVLNFQVENIDTAVDGLLSKGVTFEQYPEMKTDQKGVVRYEGRSMGWFKDPAGNIFSVISESK